MSGIITSLNINWLITYHSYNARSLDRVAMERAENSTIGAVGQLDQTMDQFKAGGQANMECCTLPTQLLKALSHYIEN